MSNSKWLPRGELLEFTKYKSILNGKKEKEITNCAFNFLNF
jgi:hypothetical protein